MPRIIFLQAAAADDHDGPRPGVQDRQSTDNLGPGFIQRLDGIRDLAVLLRAFLKHLAHMADNGTGHLQKILINDFFCFFIVLVLRNRAQILTLDQAWQLVRTGIITDFRHMAFPPAVKSPSFTHAVNDRLPHFVSKNRHPGPQAFIKLILGAEPADPHINNQGVP